MFENKLGAEKKYTHVYGLDWVRNIAPKAVTKEQTGLATCTFGNKFGTIPSTEYDD